MPIQNTKTISKTTFSTLSLKGLGRYVCKSCPRTYQVQIYVLSRHQPVFAERGRKRPHHRCFELIVSSSFNQSMAVERGRSHEQVGSMVGSVHVHVLRTLAPTSYSISENGNLKTTVF